MTDREKLTDVIYSMDLCSWDWAGKIADHLIANGVTLATDNNVGNKWIPVSEQLPEQYESVLGWTKYNEMGEVEYDGMHFRWAYDDDYAHVTHWMPLPEPPKEDGYE